MRIAALVSMLVFAACAPSPFSYGIRDTRPSALAGAKPAPAPAAQEAFLLGDGEIIAWDLQTQRARWRARAAVASRIVLGPNVLVYLDRSGQMVARERASGNVRWQFALGNKELIGMTVGAASVFVTTAEPVTGKSKRRFWIEAWDGQKGYNRWVHESDAPLGAPVLARGLVAVPYVEQWLVLFDEASGKLEGRLRSADEAIEFATVVGGDIYYGSRKSLRRIDESQPTRVFVPPALTRANFARNAYDPVQASYSANDRARILWRPDIAATGNYAVAMERYLFAIDRSGALRWARSMKAPIVSAVDTGPSIVYATADGTVGLLGPAGETLAEESLGAALAGATFDADNLQIANPGTEPPDTRAVLLSIARDRDSRYRPIQTYAVAALAAEPGFEAATDLLTVIDDPDVAPVVRAAAETAVIELNKPEAFPALIAALRARPSYLQKRQPRSAAAAAAALERKATALTPEQRQEATSALLACFEHPGTDQKTLPAVIKALDAFDDKSGVLAIRRFVLSYRSDPAFAQDPQAMTTALDVLLTSQDAWNREIVTFTAADPRTQPAVRDYARAALAR